MPNPLLPSQPQTVVASMIWYQSMLLAKGHIPRHRHRLTREDPHEDVSVGVGVSVDVGIVECGFYYIIPGRQ